MELESDLRNTSDTLLQTLDRLGDLEKEKRALDPTSQRFQRLAEEIERLAAIVFSQTHAQNQLGERASEQFMRTGEPVAPIAETTVARELPVILADWREAERRLAASDPETAEHAEAEADALRLRDEYHRSYDASQRKAGRHSR